MDISAAANLASRLRDKLNTLVFGQEAAVDLLLVGLLSDGHVLLEGIPGTAKTTLVKSLAQISGLGFRRVQLTPDMLPAEIIGTSIYDLNSRNFTFKQGPVFTDLLLADEINRTPPKTQSALLEAMEEHQVTTDGEKHLLPDLFTVFATLNPVEFEGTYPLPEAQLDRFLLKIKLTYPNQDAEKKMLREFADSNNTRHFHQRQLEPMCTREELLACRNTTASVRVEDSLIDYILQITTDTRQNPNIELGASPRSALSLLAAGRAYAVLSDQDFVTPDHIKALAPPVLRHRLILTAEAELDGLNTDDVIAQALSKTPVPR